MTGILIAVRDFLVLLALSWIGVALEPTIEPRDQAKAKAEVSACMASATACSAARPGFEAERCG